MTKCPKCGSDEIFQPDDIKDEELYPILECKNCGERWFSD